MSTSVWKNEHNLDGIMGTFGQTARYGDEPWGAHYTGRQEVRAFWLCVMRRMWTPVELGCPVTH
jgi:hypothetical protein